MKVLVVLSVVLAMAASYPVVRTWTLQKLSKAIESKSEPALQPYLEDALNQIMFNLFSGKGELSQYTIPSPSGAAKWSIEELMAAKASYPPDVNDEYYIAITQAIAIYKQKQSMGEVPKNVEVIIPAMDISVWTLDDLKEALSNDNVNPELKPRLEKALFELETNGSDDTKKTIGLVTSVGLVPHKNESYGKKQKTKKEYRFKHLHKRIY